MILQIDAALFIYIIGFCLILGSLSENVFLNQLHKDKKEELEIYQMTGLVISAALWPMVVTKALILEMMDFFKPDKK